MDDEYILHSDLNCFYAGVEVNENPALRNLPVAVCGSTENRHGIVLAKTYEAKRMGVKTGQANWEALKACPGLITVEPHYEKYLMYSKLVRSIYARYACDIEPFGMDENWLRFRGLGSIEAAAAIADEIRIAVKTETGLTVSIGVSFTKVFAKLGSDLKKPDAITVISRDNFRQKIWPLPVSELLYVGPHTTKKHADIGVYTIGQLALFPESGIRQKLGKNGAVLKSFAQGIDGFKVMPEGRSTPIKSVGHGATCVRDIDDAYEIWRVIYELVQDISHRLRKNGLAAGGVSIYVRDFDLFGQGWQALFKAPTRCQLEIAQRAYALFNEKRQSRKPVRSITVCAICLKCEETPVQLDIFGDYEKREKLTRLSDAVDEIRRRFGTNSIKAASLMGDNVLATDKCETVPMPERMYGL